MMRENILGVDLDDKWISLQEYVPENNRIVLCCDIYENLISIGRYFEEKDEFYMMSIEGIQVDSTVTHWMNLPELPLY